MILLQPPARGALKRCSVVEPKETPVTYDEIRTILNVSMVQQALCLPVVSITGDAHHVAIMCDEEGLINGQTKHGVTLIRPWDAAPLVGPLLFLEVENLRTEDEMFVDLDPEIQARILDALYVLGWNR